MNGITKETFLNAEDAKNRDAMLYDMLDGINNKIVIHQGEIGSRVKKLEDRRKKDTAVASASGVLGGALALMGKWFFFK